MKRNLEIHYLHRQKKTPLCLEHRYYNAVNMGSDYVGIVFLGHGVEASFLHMVLSLSYITHQSPVIHLKFFTVLPLGGLKNNLF